MTPVIACFKWGKGYPVHATNVLFRALRDLMSTPFDFVCITDESDGLDAGIKTRPLPAFALDRQYWVPGMWPKLSVFHPDLFAGGTPVLMIDVDVVVIRDLAPVFDHITAHPGLHIIHDWPNLTERLLPWSVKAPRMSNSSVVGFVAGAQEQIWDSFHTADWAELEPQINDQDFIHHHATHRQYWPKNWMLSFKKSVVWHVPLNYLFSPARPDQAFVVAFHGSPNPEDVTQPKGTRWGTKERFGYAPVGWVADYLHRYANPR